MGPINDTRYPQGNYGCVKNIWSESRYLNSKNFNLFHVAKLCRILRASSFCWTFSVAANFQRCSVPDVDTETTDADVLVEAAKHIADLRANASDDVVSVLANVHFPEQAISDRVARSAHNALEPWRRRVFHRREPDWLLADVAISFLYQQKNFCSILSKFLKDSIRILACCSLRNY